MALSVASCSLINIKHADVPLTTAQINAEIAKGGLLPVGPGGGGICGFHHCPKQESACAALRSHPGITDSAAIETTGSLLLLGDEYGNGIDIPGSQLPNEIRWNTQLFIGAHKGGLSKPGSLAALTDRSAARDTVTSGRCKGTLSF